MTSAWRPRAVTFLCAATATLLLAGSAQAATVTVQGGNLSITENVNAAELNTIRVTIAGANYRVNDATGPNLTVAPPCTYEPPATSVNPGKTALCPAATVTGSVDIDVGDGNDFVYLDSATLPATLTSTVLGGPGEDKMYGLVANTDTISGQGDVDEIRGNGGDDVLEGGTGTDSLYGDAGADTLRGGADADDLNGGAGDDTVDYATIDGAANPNAVGAAIEVISDSGANCKGTGGGACEGDVIRLDVENLTGTAQNDRLVGDADDNALSGLAGNDALVGAAGADTLLGGNGDDSLRGDTGADVMDGGSGGSGGTDTVTYAGRGDENLTVDLGVATATNGGASDDGPAAGTSNDTITLVENVITDEGDDLLRGNGADNVLSGGAGTDQFRGLGLADTFNGDAGTDTVFYDDSSHVSGGTPTNNLTITIGAGTRDDGNSTDQNTGGFRDDVTATIENVTGGPSDDAITGSAAANTLDGGSTGNDTLIGLGGADLFLGGGTSTGDRVSYADRTGAAPGSNISATIDGLANDGAAGEGDLVDASIEHLTGGAGDDTLAGSNSANTLAGGGGNDALRGGLGGDSFSGGGGTADLVDYSQDAGRVAGITATIGAGASDDGAAAEGDDVQADVENVRGTAFNDTMEGDSDANTLEGLAGTDDLAGFAGNDIVDGGDGAGDDLSGGADSDTLDGGSTAGNASDSGDTIDGGLGTDTVTYRDRTAAVTVTLDNLANDGDPAGPENDQITLVENVEGGDGNDTLTGSTGLGGTFANRLDGRGGDDDLLPGDEPGTPVADTLIGGGGLNDEVDYTGRTAALTVTLDDTANDGFVGPNPGPADDEKDDIDGTVEDVTTGSGNDDVTGDTATGNEIVTAGGDDDVDVRDSTLDTVDCGAGASDDVVADRQDSVNANCETVDAGPLTVRVEPAAASVNESAGTAAFNIVVDDLSAQDVTVNYATGDVGDTATAGQDYTAQSSSATVTSVDVDRTVQVTVPITDDPGDELDETLSLKISSPVNATIATGGDKATTTIVDNDVAELSIANDTVTEGDSGTTTATFDVTLDNASAHTVTVDYATGNDSAVAPGDYTAETGTLTFNPGDTTEPVTVDVHGDTLDELDEDFDVTLTNPTEATLADADAVGAITDDDDSPTVSISDASVDPEGAAATTANAQFTVSLSEASSKTIAVDVDTADGTAVQPGDYVQDSDTLTFTPGQTTKTFDVVVNGDAAPEADETFSVALSNPSETTLGDASGTATIVDDDVPSLSVNDATVSEGNSGVVNTQFTVTLSTASTRSVTVQFGTADGTAGASDYDRRSSETLTFSPGQTTKTIDVSIQGDALDEADETFTVELSGADGASIGDGSGLGTITDNDPTPTLATGDVSLTEGNSGTKSATFDVKLSAASGREVKVDFTTANGTATAGSDYTAKSGTLTIAAGDTTGQVAVDVAGDAAFEGDETFTLTLSTPVNATIEAGKGAGTATIGNDDAAPSVPTISLNDPRVAEGTSTGGTATFVVTLSAAAASPVTVAFATADGSAKAGSDYTAGSGSLTFAPGETTKSVPVGVTGDSSDEPDETFALVLANPSGATLAKAFGAATITDDDVALVPRRRPALSSRVRPARDRTSPYAFKATGKLTLPAGVTKAAGCKGSVTVRVKRGSRTVLTRRLTLRSSCTYSGTIRLPRSTKAGRLKVTFRFGGNTALLARSATTRSFRAG